MKLGHMDLRLTRVAVVDALNQTVHSTKFALCLIMVAQENNPKNKKNK